MAIWKDMKPITKITIVICVTIIVVASMIYGYFPELIKLIPGVK